MQDGCPGGSTDRFKIPSVQWRKIQEDLVDGIDLDVRYELEDGSNDPSRHFGIQRVVGGADDDPVLLDEMAALEDGFSHRDTQVLGFLGSRDHASIVVGEHDDGSSFESWFEDTFTGCVEVVAVGQGVHGITVDG